METKLFGAGSDLGVHIDGARLGPTQLINDVKNYCLGDIFSIKQDDSIIKSRNLSDRRKNEYEVVNFDEELYNLILENSKEGCFPITIGGDHSIAIASCLASTKRCDKVGLIWIDAHGDYNTFKTTSTGNMHGLPLAAITGFQNHELITFHDGRLIEPSKTVIVGARSLDPEEKDNLRYSGVTVFSTADIREKGLEFVMNEAFRIAGIKTDGIHISYDIDVLDPDIAPGVSVPEFDGLTEEEGMKINEIIIKNINNVIAYDLVEFNPLRDEKRKTEQIAVNLLVQIIKAAQKKGKKYN